jgi:hypothetical protein
LVLFTVKQWHWCCTVTATGREQNGCAPSASAWARD